jgi:hypothetical protein
MLPATANPNGGGVTLGDVAGELIAVALQQKEFDQTQKALVGQKDPSRSVYDKLDDIEKVLAKNLSGIRVVAHKQFRLFESLVKASERQKDVGALREASDAGGDTFEGEFSEVPGDDQPRLPSPPTGGVGSPLSGLAFGAPVIGGALLYGFSEEIAGMLGGYTEDLLTEYTDLTKEELEVETSNATNAFEGALKGAGIGAAIGSFIPGIGTLLGAGIGGIVGTLFGGGPDERPPSEPTLAGEPIVNEFDEFSDISRDQLAAVTPSQQSTPQTQLAVTPSQQSTPQTTSRINTAPRTRSARSEEAALRKEKLAEKLVEEQEKQLVIEEEKTAIVEEEKSRAEENLYALEGLYEAKQDQKKAAEELAKFEKEAGEKVEIGFDQEMFDLTGQGSIMGYADTEKQAQFEQLRSADISASSKATKQETELAERYAQEMGIPTRDGEMLSSLQRRGKNFKGVDLQGEIEKDLSQLQPVLGYEYGTKDYIGMEARARGGPVEDGSDYLVGEEGPELMIPNEDGTIIPAGVSKELMKYQQQGFDVTVDNGNITLFRENEDGSSETLKSDGTRTVSGSFGTYVFDENNEVISYTKPTMAEGLSVTDYYKGDLAGERATSFSASTFNKTQFSDLASGAITGESLSVNDYSGGGRSYRKDRSGKFTGSDTFTGESYEGSSFEDVMGQMPVLTDRQRAERMFGTLDQQRAAFERPGRTPEQIDEMMAPIIKAFEQSYDEKGNLIGNEDFLPIDPNKLIPSRNEGSYLSTSQQQMSQQSSQPVVVNAPQTSNSPVVNNTSVNNMSMPMSPRTHDESFTRTNNQNYNFG